MHAHWLCKHMHLCWALWWLNTYREPHAAIHDQQPSADVACEGGPQFCHHPLNAWSQARVALLRKFPPLNP